MPNRGSKSKYTMAGEEDGGEQVALELIKAFLEEAPSTTLTRAPARCAELVISIPGTRLSNDAVVNAPRQANSEPWNAAAVDTTQWPALGKAANTRSPPKDLFALANQLRGAFDIRSRRPSSCCGHFSF